MNDIKSLYLAAKTSGKTNDVSVYTEAIHEFLESNPSGYISNLEYIISSDIGLQTLPHFVEKNGLPISCHGEIISILEKCIEKCKTFKKDDTPFREALNNMEDFRKKYIGCFMMESYFSDQLPENYVSTYYGKNSNGIPNRKLMAGLLEKFGEAAIPDIIVTANSISPNALKTAIQFIESNQKYGNPVVCEWVLEAAKDFISGEPEMLLLEKKSVGRIVHEAKNRNHQLYREAVITDNDEIMMEYSDTEMNALADFISFNEYKLTWADELNLSLSDIQNDIYSLYEEYEGFINADCELMTESTKEERIAANKIVKNMKALSKRILSIVKPGIKDAVKKYNSTKSILSPVIQYPITGVVFRDRNKKDKIILKNLVTKNLDNIIDSNSKFVDCVELGLVVRIDSLSKSHDEKSFKIYQSAINDTLKPLINEGIISFKKTDSMIYIQMKYMVIPVYMSRDYLMNGVDSVSFESCEGFDEFVADSVIPMLPSISSTEPIEEAQWLLNTRNKKTGDIPGYIKRNHKLDYGEDQAPSANNDIFDKNDKSSEIQAEPSLDDFKRPSAEDMAQSYSGLDVEPEKTPTTDAPMTQAERNAINNYYYYTYNNSHNRNSGSFNRDNSHHDDHSTTTKKTVDDHSYGKRINSDDNNTSEGGESIEEVSLTEGVGTIILATPIVLGAGAVIASLINSKIMSAKYHKKMLEAISEIIGKKVTSDKEYLSSASKKITELISSKEKDIISKFYKFTETEEKIIKDPNVFFTFKSSKSNTDSSNFKSKDLLIKSDEILFGLLKKDDIKSVSESLEKLSDEVKLCLSHDENLPGDDNGGDWGYFIKAGICEGGPDDFDGDEDKGGKWIDDQIQKIKQSGYCVYSLSAVIDATNFLNKNFKETKDSLISEAVGDADDNRPESDHPVKDIMTDIDRNLTKKQQSAKKVVQNVQNTGRAFVKPAVRTQQWISSMVGNWKDADENNIKERMADPHARSRLFSVIKIAITGGSLLKAGLLLNPIFLFLTATRGLGKNKRAFRIRNEMIGELKTELEVIDEKIKDADRVGDNQSKYKLMRFKNELNKKLLRVGGPKGWSKII